MIQSDFLEYNDNKTLLQAFYAYDDNIQDKQPIILIAHDWSGNNEFAQQKARQIASLGYIGFALDMYGKGKRGQTKEEKMALMQPLMDDRKMLADRMLAGLNAAKSLSMGDKTKIGAIGFCFGGLCVLDLARSGADIKGAVSFHGLFNAPNHETTDAIKASILALHGFDDPMAGPDDLLAFSKEMTSKKADWQVHLYGGTMHAFTNPEANDPDFGTVYDAKADKRSWQAMVNFFAEVL